ncbi:SLAM family member 7 isoform X1 [Nannospalax galili]|uniref:SLAM family member 7 isoform X1 n=1 Tax=Nannospalax galili TaxID=1026970 RepID=UPI0004ED5569|nr:SLAM family member 7 isoform X1 [Nannospalax galili]
MAGFPTSIILTSLLCQITVTVAFGTLKELAGAIDGSVTFTLNITVKQVDSIVWTFKTLSLVTIQPSKNRKQDNVIVAQNRNKERIAFSEGDYSLKLSQLKKNDSGVYRVEIYSTSSQSPFTQEYVLHVYEYLSKPKVTRGLQNNKNGTCITNLTCSIEQGGENVTYSWRVMGQAANESHDGSFLPISWRLGETDMTFICTARNPISNSSSSPILSWELCEGAANDPKFSVVFTVVLLTVLFTVIVLLLTVAFIVRTEKRKDPIEDRKRVDIHQETPNFCPHFGENTEYDTVPYTNKRNPVEDAANTLYSTVQIPKVVKSPSNLPATPDTSRSLSFENVL